MRRQPSVMPGGHQFSQVPRAEIPRSRFDRSFGHKTTFDAGWLVPVYCDEALPGDTFTCRMSAFARLATPLKPIMDNMVMESFFFFVPNRLLWSNWEKFNGAQEDPGDSTDFTIPVCVATLAPSALSLHDYFGLPVGITVAGCSTMWHRAYHLIWNDWFRDQNLQDSEFPNFLGDGPDAWSNALPLLRRGKRHDYFTSCLPWPQKGDSVSIPLGTSAEVHTNALEDGKILVGTPQIGAGVQRYLDANLAEVDVSASTGSGGPLYADLTDAAAATINQLRQAFQVQKLLERDARGGTRYTEIVKSHFGVTSPDARLQRPEYLGGGSSPVVVSPVAQTSVTAGTPQGNLAAVGTVNMQGHGFSKSFTEHGVLLGLVSVRADLTYQEGLERMWSRSTRYDFYWPSLSHIGEQSVFNREIYMNGTSQDDDVFGYQERYAEYRYKPSKITGQFRSGHAQTLDMWHLSQEFGGLPTLGDTFIQENPPVDRVIAVPAEPHFLFDSFFKLTCARPMPMYGVPGMIDHF